MGIVVSSIWMGSVVSSIWKQVLHGTGYYNYRWDTLLVYVPAYLTSPGVFLCIGTSELFLERRVTNYLLIADVNECVLPSSDYRKHNCDQLCNNTFGGFTCACREGWWLDTDGHTCTGKSEPALISTLVWSPDSTDRTVIILIFIHWCRSN